MKHSFYHEYLRMLLCAIVLCFVQTAFAQMITIGHATDGFVINVNNVPNSDFTNLFRAFIISDADGFGKMVFDMEGQPTMDELYCFVDVPAELAPYLNEMKGECYFIFHKNGNEYMLYDANPVTKKNFNFPNCNGMKLYFTGTCTTGYTGNPIDSNPTVAGRAGAGVFYLQGKTEEQVDIYLHNFEMKVQDKQLRKVSLGNLFQTFNPKNMASVFAIGSEDQDTGNPFTANFHICGTNTLTGGNQSVFAAGGNNYEKVLANILTITNSPIAIIPMAKSVQNLPHTTARLVFDDIVPIQGTDTHVNGTLNLPLSGSRSTPSIDLGNGNGFCEFNGGQYRFATPASNSMFYVCSMAICYKQLTLMGNTLFGIGSSVGISTTSGSGNKVRVTFNDGTFSTYPANEFKDDNIDVLARGWYNDYTDLRVSYESRVNGGTFNNCRVYRCDASGERGISPVNNATEALCYKSLNVSAPANQNGTLSAEQVTTIPFLKDFSTTYGANSLTPLQTGDEYKINVYLPLTEGCDEEVTTKQYIHNWVSVIPKMGADSVLTMGGDVEVMQQETDGNNKRTNGYLFYARLNEQTKKYAYVDFGPLRATVQMAINFAGNKEYSSVTNNAAYNIEYGLYTMLSFRTNQWYMLTMPYDVANIYVIETTGTQKGKHPTIGPSETVEQFLVRQGQADGNLASTIVTSLCPDIFSGKGSGVLMNLIDIVDKQLPDSANIYPLIPYTGNNANQAHYYLYEQKPDDDDGDGFEWWNFSTNANDYGKKWKYVTPQPFAEGKYIDQNGNPVPAGNIIMKQGQVYSLLLPDTEDSRYWDGKYLIFEGYGPQTINGRIVHDKDEGIFDGYIPQMDIDDDMAIIQGNASFANDTTFEQVYLPTRSVDAKNNSINYEFIRANKGTVVKPCEVIMTLSETNSNWYGGILRRGSSLSSVQTSDNVAASDNVPTIDKIMLIASAFDKGILLRSAAEQQVSIYTIDGRLLYSDRLSDGSVVRIPATAGVYLVQGQEQTYKLIVP